MVCLSELHGLWRRTLIAWPDGREDMATEVYWLQGPRHFADLRIPPGRPELGTGACLRDLDWPMLRFMARQEGFIGHLEMSDGIAQWHRAFDYQPETGVSDKGRLSFEGDTLIEQGVETPYVEHWRREPDTAQDVMAAWLAADSRVGCLIAAGDAFIYARGRAKPLPRDTDLSCLLDTAGSLEAAQELFDCEISFGRRSGEEWRIERSSLPFREGRLLKPELDGERESL
ncbi:MAG TPA: hypothetical protein VLB11_03610, partial [Methyloceanibacter sp.]|nr:hypothetical protein [Methyloceanibacter sp.]